MKSNYRDGCEELEKIFNAVTDSIVISDGNRMITRLNDAAGHLFGINSIGKACYQVLRERAEPCAECPFHRPDKEESLFTAEVAHAELGKQFHLTITPIFENGILKSMVHVIRDITVQKQLESRIRITRRFEALGVLAGGMIHSLNNMLHPILGYAELLMEDTPENTVMRQDAEQILLAARRASELAAQVGAFTHMESVHPSPLSIQLMLKESARLLHIFLPAHIQIKTDINIHTKPVLATPFQLYTLIISLCAYSYQAMWKTGGVLKITLESEDNQVKLIIEDTGGDSVRKELLDTTDTESSAELSVLYDLAAELGGTLTVQTKRGFGVRFEVILPCADVQSPDIKFTERSLKGSERILLIDDEDSVLISMKQMLGRLGYQVTVFSDAYKALEAFRSQPQSFDLVITDQIMPGIDGIQFSEQLRSIRSDIPVILCTGFLDPAISEQAKTLGIQGCLMKPVGKSQLSLIVRQVLDEKKARILVVDNDAHIRGVLIQMLTRAGYDVSEACDGEEAVRVYREHPADIVIMDILMPKKDGKEAIYELKKDFPKVKIIAISGGGWFGPKLVLEVAKDLGAVRTLAKPIDRTTLLKTVRELLS